MHQDVPKEDVIIESVTVSSNRGDTLYCRSSSLRGRTGDTAGFLRFLAGEARKADALYILAICLKPGSATTIPTHFITDGRSDQSGIRFRRSLLFHSCNRDFLLGKRFARESGMTLLRKKRCSNFMVVGC